MTSLSTLRSTTKADYNTLVNFQSAVKAMNEGKRVHFLTWKNLTPNDRLAVQQLGSTSVYVRQHINSNGRIKDTSIVTDHEMQSPDWVITV